MQHTPILAPSLLAADFTRLGEQIAELEHSEADWYHLDIMDGLFVPNISYGMPIVKAIRRAGSKPLDVHLMIVDPDRYLAEFAKLGAHLITVHLEAVTHLHRTVQSIHDLGIRAGVALNPHTPVSLLEPIIRDLDLVLLMSVNPGFGGQSFIPYTFEKITQLKSLIERSGSQARIEIDGGVNLYNAADLIRAGADTLVAGSALFSVSDLRASAADFKRQMKV
jgi:ribulose-phosphate 3-epimerase